MSGATNLPGLHWGHSVVIPPATLDSTGVFDAYEALVNDCSLWVVEERGASYLAVRPRMTTDSPPAAVDSLVPNMRVILARGYVSYRLRSSYTGSEIVGNYGSSDCYIGICPDCEGNALQGYNQEFPYSTGADALRWSRYMLHAQFQYLEKVFLLFNEEMIAFCGEDGSNNRNFCTVAGAVIDPLHADQGEDTYAGQGAPLEGIYRLYGVIGGHRQWGMNPPFWERVEAAWSVSNTGNDNAKTMFIPRWAAEADYCTRIEHWINNTSTRNGVAIGRWNNTRLGIPFHFHRCTSQQYNPADFVGQARQIRIWRDRVNHIELKQLGGGVEAILLGCRPNSSEDTVGFVNP